MPVYYTKNAKETEALAETLAKKLKAGDVIAYRGGLGGGKTTFTRGLAKGLGIDDHVYSPTFALVNEYYGNGIVLYHFDMYRITDADSLSSTGFFDYLETKDGILAIEWSENIEAELPENTIFITFEIDGNNTDNRTITIKGGRF